ncbi:MAG: HAD-IA family hydrolase [Rhizobiales bacterium]|nr:HAD-IA family hydrolase [Hyphomicrobiales bacterium]
MPARAVIFDMGNVLIDWDPHKPYRQHLPDVGDRLAFLNQFFRVMYDAVHDDPRSMGDCLIPLKEAHPDKRHLIEVYEKEWHLFLGGPMPESIAIVDALHARNVPLYGLTNWPHQVWPPHEVDGVEAPEGYAFLEKFRDVLVSGRERMRKPEARIYELALSRFGLQADEAVFVDDLVENVEAARACGMYGVHFTGALALERELMELGLLPATD